MKTVIFACVLATAATAAADDTFEAKAADAIRIHRLENVVWAFTAPCDAGDDVQQRQCRQIRDARAKELSAATLLVDADSDAFDVGAWSSQKKSVPLTLSACIRCAGVDIDGKTWFVLGTTAPPQFVGGKLKAGTLHDNGRTFADPATAKQWARAVSGARVQLIAKLPTKPRWTVDGKTGLSLEILGYRVYTPCDGAIVASKPPSGPVEADKKQCAPLDAGVDNDMEIAKLDALTAAMIQDALKPVVDAGAACFERFGVAGKGKLKLTIAGDGSIAKYEQQGDFTDTPTGKCIDTAAAKVKFPVTKRPKTTISYPIVLE